MNTQVQLGLFTLMIMTGDSNESMVRMWLATEFEWEDRLVIEFGLSNFADGSLDGETG